MLGLLLGSVKVPGRTRTLAGKDRLQAAAEAALPLWGEVNGHRRSHGHDFLARVCGPREALPTVAATAGHSLWVDLILAASVQCNDAGVRSREKIEENNTCEGFWEV